MHIKQSQRLQVFYELDVLRGADVWGAPSPPLGGWVVYTLPRRAWLLLLAARSPPNVKVGDQGGGEDSGCPKITLGSLARMGRPSTKSRTFIETRLKNYRKQFRKIIWALGDSCTGVVYLNATSLQCCIATLVQYLHMSKNGMFHYHKMLLFLCAQVFLLNFYTLCKY